MFIQVICQNPTHTGRTRAKRRFDNGTKYRLEVIDRAEDFFVDEDKKFGDMNKINRAGAEAIKGDPVFSVLEDGAVGDAISAGLIENLKAKLAAQSGDLSNAQVENERLTLALEQANADKDKLAADLQAAEALLAGGDGGAGTPDGSAPSTSDAGHVEGEKGGKAKGGKAKGGSDK